MRPAPAADPAGGLRFSRRHLLGGGAGLAAAGVLGGCSSSATSPATSAASASSGVPAGGTVPFHGAHQAGIATAAQDRLAFAAFDVVTADRGQLRDLLHTWTEAAAAMTEGRPVPGRNDDPHAPPADTGEAVGLDPARLTVTVGFGPSLFDHRFGLPGRRPAALADLPPLPGDELIPALCGGDLAIQACADDPQVAFHVIRNLARLGRGIVTMRWSQLGFGRTSATTDEQATPRNLMGFKDGTRNVKAENAALMGSQVWVGDGTDQAWMRGGSYLVTRRIRMLVEAWDRDFLADQENVFGRHKHSGAPLGGRDEFDTPDLAARDAAGELVVPADAHIRLASPQSNGGAHLLRRGYSYTDGIDPVTGELDAGLFFICFQQDPRRQFVPIQRRLGTNDALTEYIKHTSSAVFACPPGVAPGKSWGDPLFS